MTRQRSAGSGRLRAPPLAWLCVIGEVSDALDDADGFARCGVERLPRLAASELTTLSLCDLQSGRRHVVGLPAGAIDADALAGFDRHFVAHPLVRYHAGERGRYARRISDLIAFREFRETSLHQEYYRRIGVDHAVALPVHVDERWLVRFVLNRGGRHYSDRELALLDQVRAVIGRLFRCSGLPERTSRGAGGAALCTAAGVA